jgi:hypothetical protein
LFLKKVAITLVYIDDKLVFRVKERQKENLKRNSRTSWTLPSVVSFVTTKAVLNVKCKKQ